jgi:hypothetical protein
MADRGKLPHCHPAKSVTGANLGCSVRTDNGRTNHPRATSRLLLAGRRGLGV